MAQQKHEQKSKVLKRSVVINGHKTSISLEEDFWTALGAIAATQNASISEVVTVIDRDRKHDNLSSAIRLYVLDYYRQLAGNERAPELVKSQIHGFLHSGGTYTTIDNPLNPQVSVAFGINNPGR